jgi:hypothetical protein
MIVRFTNADYAPPRHATAHEFAWMVHENWLKRQLQECSNALQESGLAAPHQSPRDSMWVEFMLASGISDEELELAKRI